MGGFKRFCMFVFGLAGLLGVIALSLTWVGPWTSQASALMSVENYFYAVEVCVAIALVIMLVVLLRAIFARSVRTIEVTTVNGGTISVSRDAIASQATHIVEADGTCSADRVDVKAKKSGHVRVHVRVLPHESVDVVAKGAELHDELVRGLASVCGDKIDRVSLEFIEPESVTVATPASATESEPLPEAAPAYEPPAVEETEPAERLDSTSEITVSMGGSRAASDADRQEA